jgi:hypothetical protein
MEELLNLRRDPNNHNPSPLHNERVVLHYHKTVRRCTDAAIDRKAKAGRDSMLLAGLFESEYRGQGVSVAAEVEVETTGLYAVYGLEGQMIDGR